MHSIGTHDYYFNVTKRKLQLATNLLNLSRADERCHARIRNVSTPLLQLCACRMFSFWSISLEIFPRCQSMFAWNDVLPPKIAQRLVHQRPVLAVALDAIHGASSVDGVTKQINPWTIEYSHQPLDLRDVVPRHCRVRLGGHWLAFIEWTLDFQHAAGTAVGVRRVGSNQPIRRRPNP